MQTLLFTQTLFFTFFPLGMIRDAEGEGPSLNYPSEIVCLRLLITVKLKKFP